MATPDVREEKLTSQDELMILASDGLWDVLSNQEAISMIKDIPVSTHDDTKDLLHFLSGSC